MDNGDRVTETGQIVEIPIVLMEYDDNYVMASSPVFPNMTASGKTAEEAKGNLISLIQNYGRHSGLKRVYHDTVNLPYKAPPTWPGKKTKNS